MQHPNSTAPTAAFLRCACDAEQNRCISKKLDYCTTIKTCFTAVVRLSDDHETLVTFGCLSVTAHSQFSCNVGSKRYVAIKCCDSGDFCNKDLHPVFEEAVDAVTAPAAAAYDNIARYAMYGLVALVILLGVSVLIAWQLIKKNRKRFKAVDLEKKEKIIAYSPTSNFLGSNLSWSGSGSGARLLCRRTVARSIDLIELIGKGRYGQVWKGCYQGELVAVKMFASHAEASWCRECFIYTTALLRHDHILSFVAADTISRLDSATQLWIVTKYHKNGSLFDFLNRRAITLDEAVRLLSTAASGLSHLHQQIHGSQGKPGIAHRDVKSRNLLVTNDLQCCVADLGLALVDHSAPPLTLTAANSHQATCLLSRPHPSSAGSTAGSRSRVTSPSPSSSHVTALTSCDVASRLDCCDRREGTRRYMSPEVISGSIDCGSFEAFKRSDVYSFGLVVWETINRVIKISRDYRVSTVKDKSMNFDIITAPDNFTDYRVSALPDCATNSHAATVSGSFNNSLGQRIEESLAMNSSGYTDVNYSLFVNKVMGSTANDFTINKMETVDFHSGNLLPHNAAIPTVNNNITANSASGYLPPYGGLVSQDPSLDDMERVVCTMKRRPLVDAEWLRHPIMRQLVETMEECWHAVPEVRPSMLRVKKSLLKLSPSIE